MSKKPYGNYVPGMQVMTPEEHARLVDEDASPKRLKEMDEFEKMLNDFKFPVKPITVKLTMTRDGRITGKS